MRLLVEVCLRSSRLTSCLTRGFSLLTFDYIIKWTAQDILIQRGWLMYLFILFLACEVAF